MLKKMSSLLALVAAVALAGACAQSDAGITTKVKTKLAADPTVKASQIDVDTKNKVVTLNGTVESQAAKDQAISIARGTSGVADVVDNLTIAGGATTGTGTPPGAGTDTGATGSSMGTSTTPGATGSSMGTSMTPPAPGEPMTTPPPK